MKRSSLRLFTNRNWIKSITNISSILTKTLILSWGPRIIRRKNYKSNKDSMTTIRFTVSSNQFILIILQIALTEGKIV